MIRVDPQVPQVPAADLPCLSASTPRRPGMEYQRRHACLVVQRPFTCLVSSGHPSRLKNQRQESLPWYDSVRRRGARLAHSERIAEPCRRQLGAGVLQLDRPPFSERENEQGNGRRQMDFSQWIAVQIPPNQGAVAGEDLNSPAISGHPTRKLVTRTCRIEPYRTFPYHGHAPAHVQERSDCGQVALPIGGEFCIPEVRSRLWQPEKGAPFMAMPEASVHEDDSLPFWKHKIGLSCEPFRMKPKPEAARPQLSPDNDLRLSVLGPDSRHQC